MALWNGRTRVPEPAQDDLSFRAEVQSAVEVMVAHRLKPAGEVLRKGMADLSRFPKSPERRMAEDVLLDCFNRLGGES